MHMHGICLWTFLMLESAVEAFFSACCHNWLFLLTLFFSLLCWPSGCSCCSLVASYVLAMSIATFNRRPYLLVFVSHYELLNNSLVRLGLVSKPVFRGLGTETWQVLYSFVLFAITNSWLTCGLLWVPPVS